MVIVYFDDPVRACFHHKSMLSLLFSNPLPAGTVAPDWTMPDQDGRVVTLADLRGKNVVMVFYPRDETPTCRAQLCEFRDAWEQANAKNTVVFGINPQKASSHAGFRKNNALPFPLLVDEGGKVCDEY